MSNERNFEITDINLVGSYIFDLPKNEDCTICRNTLHAASIYNQEKGIDSYVVSGICQHSYHNECIKSWIDKNKYCPICFEKWETSINPNIKDSNNKMDSNDEYKDLPDLVLHSDISNNQFIHIKELIKKKSHVLNIVDNFEKMDEENELQNHNKIVKTINIISNKIDNTFSNNIINTAKLIVKEMKDHEIKENKHIFIDDKDIDKDKEYYTDKKTKFTKKY